METGQSLDSKVTRICSRSQAPTTSLTPAPDIPHTHTQKSWIQTQTSFNAISLFEDFTAASYILDERVHTSDRKGKKKQESAEATQLFTAIFTTLLKNTLLCAVLLSTPSVVCCSSGSNFLAVLCLSCSISSEIRLQISMF